MEPIERLEPIANLCLSRCVMMLALTEEQIDWLCERFPGSVISPNGDRPPTEKRDVICGIPWGLCTVDMTQFLTQTVNCRLLENEAQD